MPPAPSRPSLWSSAAPPCSAWPHSSHSAGCFSGTVLMLLLFIAIAVAIVPAAAAATSIDVVPATVDTAIVVVPAAAALLLLLLLFTLLSFPNFHFPLKNRRIEISHPVYALLFQCSVFLTCAQALCALALAIMHINGRSLTSFGRFQLDVSAVTRQFYEVTWACVSHLRYWGEFFDGGKKHFS